MTSLAQRFLILTLFFSLFFTTASYGSQRCELSNGQVVEVVDNCPRGSTVLDSRGSSTDGYNLRMDTAAQFKDRDYSYASGIGKVGGESLGGLVDSLIGAVTGSGKSDEKSMRLKRIKEIERLQMEGSISSERARELKEFFELNKK